MPSIDVGLAMAAKILTQKISASQINIQTVDPGEMSDKDGLDAGEHFMARIHKKLESWVLQRELQVNRL